MDSFDLIRTFHEVVAVGSFSRAAARLDMSKASVSKYVAELETRFGVRLLNRTTRAVSMTDAGALLLERSTPVIEMILLARADLKERASRPSGKMCISAPNGMGHGELPLLLAQFMGHYPDITVNLQLTGRAVDLAEEAIDLALCFGPVADENLIVRKLRQMPLMLCASPAYWKKHGMPEHPSELGDYHALALSGAGPHPEWSFDVGGDVLDVPVTPRMESTDVTPLIQVALQGYGMVYLPALLVQPHVDRGELVVGLEAYARTDMWLSAVYLQNRHNSAAMRALLDFLSTRLGAYPSPGSRTAATVRA
ncbi:MULTISPECIES: LysR family transcriptional regulator [unclassified Variovorax]|uniref:LysR family transcriptional regulator n=1 Tax=unclassified Variovorax TaxID=663243 RepID=UPI0008C63E58|nr:MULTISPECIES: LysR family transcriptional regulator [unclassified Variovorax]SEK09058.1 DNA-binding transcriptional regulator, LysR family [Variovorax sp. OK202]SFD60445.1 DNA-binding transcriptional regulator, LysR family [Variovorax sp. OK212]